MKRNLYLRLKPSGVEWLGDVPEHWDVTRFRRLIVLIKNGTSETQVEETDETLPVTRIETISGGKINFDKVGHIERFDRCEEYRLNKGDLMLSHINSLSMIGNCAIYNDSQPLYSGMNLLRIVPNNKYDAKWIWYLIVSDGFRRNLSARAKPAINQASLTTGQIREMNVPLPPLSEQQTIAVFLDCQTGKIDTLVEKKKRLVELLKEKRTALISHAVTKGLNPKAKMKPSGIEWLGDVPEHWDVKRLKFIGSALIGLTYSPEDVVNDDFDGQKALVLRSTNIQNGRISLHDNVYVSCDIPDELFVRAEDILICARNGSRDLVGKNAFIKEKIAGVTFGAFTTVFRSNMNKFLFHAFNSSIFKYQSTGFLTTTINQLTNGNLNSILIPHPPLSEQQSIVEYLDHEMDKIDRLIAKVEAVIEKLKEYRTALISAAVTGKMDVRNA